MGIVVTGIGPRSGTSAMMRELIDAGYKPHRYAEAFPTYVAPAKNPEGYYDLSLDFLLDPDAKISLGVTEVVKVWSPQFRQVDWSTVGRVIVMYRNDIPAQLESILETAEAEGLELSDTRIERMFWEPRVLLRDLDVPVTYVETEQLRELGIGSLDKEAV